MPLLFLINWIFSLFTLAFIALDVYLFHEWYVYKDITIDHDYARNCLIGAIALLLFSTLGKFVVRIFTGKSSGSSANDPKMERSPEFTTLERADGSVIHIEYMGPKDAQPLLFIHGWGNNSTEWYYQKQHLASRFRLILIDLPGLGKSTPAHNGDFSVSKYSMDLQAVIKFIGKDVILWGHSIGGMIILTYFKNFSKEAHAKVKGIVLEHTTYTNPLKTSALSGLLSAIQKPIIEPLLYLHIFLAPYYRLKNWMSYFNGNLHISNALTSFAGTQTRGMVDTAALYTAIASPAVTAKGMLGMLNKYDVTESLSSIDTPALVIAADKDLATKPEASRFINAQLKNSKLVTVMPGGHMSVFERNKEVSEAAKNFIEGLDLQTTLRVKRIPVSEI
jgi:pimeloyl-ACP methyl ester carboxylesterase